MAVAQRIESLKNRRELLKVALHAEESRPCPNEVRVHQIKKDNLRLKDEMLRLSLHAGHDSRVAASSAAG